MPSGMALSAVDDRKVSWRWTGVAEAGSVGFVSLTGVTFWVYVVRVRPTLVLKVTSSILSSSGVTLFLLDMLIDSSLTAHLHLLYLRHPERLSCSAHKRVSASCQSKRCYAFRLVSYVWRVSIRGGQIRQPIRTPIPCCARYFWRVSIGGGSARQPIPGITTWPRKIFIAGI
jgi:hypothetical protein